MSVRLGPHDKGAGFAAFRLGVYMRGTKNELDETVQRLESAVKRLGEIELESGSDSNVRWHVDRAKELAAEVRLRGEWLAEQCSLHAEFVEIAAREELTARAARVSPRTYKQHILAEKDDARWADGMRAVHVVTLANKRQVAYATSEFVLEPSDEQLLRGALCVETFSDGQVQAELDAALERGRRRL